MDNCDERKEGHADYLFKKCEDSGIGSVTREIEMDLITSVNYDEDRDAN